MALKKLRLLAIASALVATTACSSSSKSGGRGNTYTLGVLTDITGLAAANSLTFPTGVKAGIGVAATQGIKIKTAVADTQTNPAQALAGAKKLVQQDHVFAVLASSALTFAAANYLAANGIPVIGAAIDGPEWITDRNMFSILGTQDYTKVYSQWGLIYKGLGVTNLASLGYSISPSSSESAKAIALSAQQAGIKVGYLNANFPFGSTNVGPTAIAIKNAGSNGLSAAIQTTTEFALISQLRQEGVDLKGVLLATGYGGDLLANGPAALQIAQGLYFLTGWEPMEMNTPATQQLAHALKTYANVSGDPTFAETQGYLAVDAFVQGIKAAGSDPTRASLIDAMLKITNYNAAGLYGPHSVSFALADRGQVSGADNCDYITQYSGSTFHLVPGMEPICGQTIPGMKVSGSS